MRQRRFRATALALMALAGSACGTSAPSPPPTPAAATFEEYAVAVCSAFDSMFNAVGNPDTGSGSVLSKSLDAAVAAGDAASAERLAAEITNELEAGRHQAELAGRWPSASPMTAQLDRVLVAFEVMTSAKQAKASDAVGAVDPQVALEQAGGVDAWFAMLQAFPDISRPEGSNGQPCPTVPITP